jgi:hypothetical protein
MMYPLLDFQTAPANRASTVAIDGGSSGEGLPPKKKVLSAQSPQAKMPSCTIFIVQSTAMPPVKAMREPAFSDAD